MAIDMNLRPWGRISAMGIAAGLCVLVAPSLSAQKIFSENFEGLALGPNVNEGVAGAKVYTATPPTGWLNDRSQMPGVGVDSTDGVTEWCGWGFASKKWWQVTAGDQRRTEWTYGSGTVMIADPDEWDDATHDKGLFNAYVTTKSIDLSGLAANSLVLTFDSSWRPEGFDDGGTKWPTDEEGNAINNQTGIVTQSYDGAAAAEILRWDSDQSGEYYKADSEFINEAVVIPLNNPAGAAALKLKFGLEKGANDWWWAVDNIAVGVPPFVSGLIFNGVSFTARVTEALGKSVNQSQPITVKLDGVEVSPITRTQEEGRLLLAYTQTPKVFAPYSKHTVSVTFVSNEGKTITDSDEFTAPGYTTATATPTSVTATITDAEWLTVDESKGITFNLDGTNVTATASRTDTTVTATYSLPAGLFASGSSHTLGVTFKTTAGETVVDSADFIAPTYATLPAWLGTPLASVSDAGMKWRTYQIATNISGTVAGAEQVLTGAMGPSLHDASAQGADGYFAISKVNYEKDGADAGRFNSSAAGSLAVMDEPIPGIPGTEGGSEYFAGEALAYVAFPNTGLYTMVVNSDDGFQVSAGTTNTPDVIVLGAYNATRGASDTAFYFKVEQAGVYRFRLVYFQGTGGASVEWFTLNSDGTAALLNGSQTGALSTYRKRTVAEPTAPANGNIETIALSNGNVVIKYTGTLKAASEVTGPFTAVDGATSPYSATPSGAQKFFIAE